MEKMTSQQIGERLEQIDLELTGDKWIAFSTIISERIKDWDGEGSRSISEAVSLMPTWMAQRLLDEVVTVLMLNDQSMKYGKIYRKPTESNETWKEYLSTTDPAEAKHVAAKLGEIDPDYDYAWIGLDGVVRYH